MDSNNIVQFLESGKSKRNDVYWFVTELLMGEALDEYGSAWTRRRRGVAARGRHQVRGRQEVGAW